MMRIIGGSVLVLFAAFCGLFWFVETQHGGQLHWRDFVSGLRHSNALAVLCFVGMLVAGGGGFYSLTRGLVAPLVFVGLAFAFLAVALADPEAILDGASVAGSAALPFFVAVGCIGAAVLHAITRRAARAANGG